MAGHASITEVSGKDSLIYVSGTEIFGANEWTLALDHSTITYSCFGDDYNGTFSGTYGWSGTLTAIHDNDAEVLHTAARWRCWSTRSIRWPRIIGPAMPSFRGAPRAA